MAAELTRSSTISGSFSKCDARVERRNFRPSENGLVPMTERDCETVYYTYMIDE